MRINEVEIIDLVLPLLDIITILFIEDEPILGIIFVALLDMVTKNRIAKISLILLVIVFN